MNPFQPSQEVPTTTRSLGLVSDNVCDPRPGLADAMNFLLMNELRAIVTRNKPQGLAQARGAGQASGLYKSEGTML